MGNSILELAEAFGVNIAAPTRSADSDRLVKAASMLREAWSGNGIARLAVNEALTTSDAFASTVGDVFDRELRDNYAATPAQWSKIGTRTTMKDFNPKKIIDLVAGSGALQRVPEHTGYPQSKYSGSTATLQLGKFGESFGYTWEMRLADQLDELKRVPNAWALKAQNTTDRATLAALATPTTGAPNTGMFNAANKNLYSGGFTSDNVQAVMTALRQVRDADGTLLVAPALRVVVGPALEFAAKRMFGATEYRTTTGGLQVVEANPLGGQDYVVMDNMPGDSWFVIPVPNGIRPAIYTGFLVGHEAPEVRYKNAGGRTLGGVEVPFEDGSFDDDTCYWRVRHVTAGATGDPTFAVGVTGGSGATALTKTGW